MNALKALLANKLLLISVAVVVVVTAGVVGFSIVSSANAAEPFYSSGYVLQVTENGTDSSSSDASSASNASGSSASYAPKVSLLSFDAEASYKNRYPNDVVFTDDSGEKQSVDKSSYAHYSDSSVSSFSKTVFTDLDALDASNILYYNLPEGQVMKNVGGKYRLENGGSPLEFTNVLLKLSDNHYLLLADDITFEVNGQKMMNYKGNGSYLEVTYVDDGVTLFSNDKGAYQTISSNAIVSLGNGATIDFGTQTVSKDGATVMSLGKMVVDLDDNVDVVEEEAAAVASAVVSSAAGGTTSSSTSSSSSSASAGSSSSGGSVVEDDTSSSTQPVYSISEGTTSPVSFSTTVNITDEKNMLTSGTSVKITERDTGAVVYESEVAAGVLNFDVTAENLKPGVEYEMSATATYTSNGSTYTKSFLDKVFKTDPVGLSFEKSYITPDEIDLNVTIGSYSDVVSAYLTLYNSKDEVVRKAEVDVVKARTQEGVEISYTNLESNSMYYAELEDVTYSNVTVATFGDAVTYQTLRKTPTFPLPTAAIDKRNTSFDLQLDESKVKDPDYGIMSYTWEVYEKSQISISESGETVITGDPVTTITPMQGVNITLDVDNITIVRSRDYVARVVAKFYDNEKYLSYNTGFTDPFSIDGLEFPTMTLAEPTELTYEHIKTIIYLNHVAAIVRSDLTSHPVIVQWTNSLGIAETENITTLEVDSSGRIPIPFEKTNLRANDTYTIQVFATIDLQDGNDPVDTFIGSAQFQTPKADTSAVNFTADEQSEQSFRVEMQMVSADESADIELEMKTMNVLTLSIYEGQDTSGTPLRSITLPGGNSQSSPYTSSLYNTIYKSKMAITPETFSLSSSDIKANTSYTIVVGKANDYTRYKNDLPIKGEDGLAKFVIKTKNTWPDLPTADKYDQQVTVEVITNSNAPKYGGTTDTNLSGTTVVGYRIKSKFPNTSQVAKKITYYMRDGRTKTSVLKSYTLEVPADGSIPSQTIWLDKDGNPGRGKDYYFSYTALIDIVGRGQQSDYIQYPDCAVSEGQSVPTLGSPVYQAPLEAPKIVMYLASQNGESLAWRYVLKDPDGALSGSGSSIARLIWKKSASSSTSESMTLGSVGEWNDLSVTGAYDNTYKLSFQYNTYHGYIGTTVEKGSDTTSDQLASQYLRNWKSIDADKFETDVRVDQERNTLTVTLNPKESEATTYSYSDLTRVTGLSLRFVTSGGGGFQSSTLTTLNKSSEIIAGATSEGTPTYSLQSTVSLLEIEDLMNREFCIDATIMCEHPGVSGVAGVSDVFTISEASTSSSVRYLNMNSGSQSEWVLTDNAGSSGYVMVQGFYEPSAQEALDGATIPVKFTRYDEDGGSGTITLSTQITKNGLRALDYSGSLTSVTPSFSKAYTTGGRSEASSSSTYFTYITPSVQVEAVSEGTDRVTRNLTVTKSSKTIVENNDIIIELLEGAEPHHKAWYTYTGVLTGMTSSFDALIPQDAEENPLEPNTEYYFKVYANILNETTQQYEQIQLTDATLLKPVQYTVKTLNNVDVNVTNVKYTAKNYSSKSIDITYTLNQLVGFTMKYRIYKSDSSGTKGSEISITWPQVGTDYTNTLSLGYNPGSTNVSKLPVNNYYLVDVSAVARTDESYVLGEDTYLFKLDALAAPLINVTVTPTVLSEEGTTVYGLKYRATLHDTKGSVVNGKYKVRLYKYVDGVAQLQTSSYDDQTFKVTQYNQLFEFTGLDVNTKYEMRIYAVLDKTNVGSTYDIETYQGDITTVPAFLLRSTAGTTVDETTVNLGDVTLSAVPDSENARIRMGFYNSSNLTTVDNIEYTIYSASGYIETFDEPFVPTIHQIGTDDPYYTFDLSPTLPAEGAYSVKAEFKKDLDGGGEAIVAQGQYDYVYVKPTD